MERPVIEVGVGLEGGTALLKDVPTQEMTPLSNSPGGGVETLTSKGISSLVQEAVR